MKRYSIIFFVLLLETAFSLSAQDKFICKTGHVYFISHTDIIDIDADNYNLSSLINIKTGDVVFMIPMRGFKFKLPLAEEHFNENYVESELYPQAKLKGKIVNIQEIDFSKSEQQYVTIEGELTLHGVSKYIKETGTFELKNGKIYAKSVFKLYLSDYKIKIPDLVINKVAPVIDIKIDMIFELFTK